MATRLEIHAREIGADEQGRARFAQYAVMQVELFDNGQRSKAVPMGYFTMNTAINTVVDWSRGDEVTGWITFRAVERWLSRIGSSTYFNETGVTWDRRSVEDWDGTTNPIDMALTAVMEKLGKRFGHRPMPIALAQVIDAYVEAKEFKALIAYLKNLKPEMLL